MRHWRAKAPSRALLDAIHLADPLRLLADVEGVAGLHLHAVGELVALDARVELAVALALDEMLLVQLPEQVELAALLLEVERAVADELHELSTLSLLRVDVAALIDAGQEGALPVLLAPDRFAAGAHGDVAGQVLVFRCRGRR